MPVGVPGEIYVGGAGVARGYLNRDRADRGTLRSRPLQRRPAARLYRTRRPRPPARERRARVPRPDRRPGQDPRLPDRAGRDRSRSRRSTPTSPSAPSSPEKTSPATSASSPTSSPSQTTTAEQLTHAPQAPPPRLHGAGPFRPAPQTPTHRQRQSRPQSTPGARSRSVRRKDAARGSAHAHRVPHRGHLGRRARRSPLPASTTISSTSAATR